MTITENFLKTYTDKTYQHTTLVNHKGMIVSLGMDEERRIYYSVLNLNDDKEESELDVNYWPENPTELRFSNEISQVGYAIAGSTLIPVVKKGSEEEGERGLLQPEEIDTFLSSTARLTADAPIQALSDQKYIYIFRQSIDEGHPDMVFKTEDGGCSGSDQRPDDEYVTDIDGNKVPIVNDTLLIDRFVLAGTELKPNLEVRYQRSRHKTQPQSSKDSLGSKDLEGNPFYEPTQELDFIKNLQQGRFSVLLLPTAIAEVQRWQIFAHNRTTELIDSFNIERGADGLFNTQGTQYYTSPDPEYQGSVFERNPGICPFTGKELIPILSQEGYGESALEFDGVDDYIELPPECIPVGNEITVSFWAYGGDKLPQNNYIFYGVGDSKTTSISIYLPWSDGNIIFDCGTVGSDRISCSANESDYKGKWTHWGFTKDDAGEMKIYCNGEQVNTETRKTSSLPAITEVFLGGDNGSFYHGKIDELRIWNRARSEDEIKEDYHHRLIGNEVGLVGYWRFDEGSGDTVYDQTENAYHGTIYGATWVKSDAPVGDHPGVRRTSFKFEGRTIASGLTSQLYYQQEKASTGYEQEEKPLKKNARVMLAAATDDETEQNYIGVLDFALSRQGKLAQVPDVLNLGEPLIDQNSEDLERLAQLQKEILELEEELNNGQWVETKVQASDPETYAYFGSSVAISEDYAIVGAPWEDTGGKENAGAAYICARNGDSWGQPEKIVPHDLESDDVFGHSVAISGKYAIVGAIGVQGSRGAAYIFVYNGNSWEEIDTPLVANDRESGSSFGYSVGISGDYAIVGDPYEDTVGDDVGAAYIFVRNGDSWEPTPKLLANDGELNDYFGRSVAISGDYAIVGASGVQGSRGAAYIFARKGKSWEPTPRLLADDGKLNDYFGRSVAISGDYAIVGASGAHSQEISGGTDEGAAYISVRNENSWGKPERLVLDHLDPGSENFGSSVAISGDYAIVGAPSKDIKGVVNVGAAYVFARNWDGWKEKSNFSASNRQEDADFGCSVAISGKYAIVGASQENSGGKEYAGAAYIFIDLTEEKEAELADKQAEAQEIQDRLALGVTLPMNLLHTDPLGLTVSGGLLEFAATQDTPQFFDSAMGQLALYFRGLEGEFFAAYYDTNTAKAEYILATTSDSIKLFARSADPHTDETTVTVSEHSTNDHYCTVTIENTPIGITETWKRVPRQALAFAKILNGEADQKVFLTTLKTGVSHKEVSISSLELASPLQQALKQGDTLILGGSKTVGGVRVIVSEDVERKATTIPIKSVTLDLIDGTAVYWLPYDYETLATANEVTYNLKKGSLLLLAAAGTAKDDVQNGTATGGDSVLSCAWVADSPGKAYDFDGIDDYIALADADETNLSKLDIKGDVTLEAWVNSDDSTRTETIVPLIHHYSPNSQYTLALKLHGDSGYTVIAGADIHAIESTKQLPIRSWQHLAAVFNQSYGLQFNGGYLKCGKASSLNIVQDLTIEIFLETGDLDEKQGLISKGKLQDGTDQNVPYSLFIDSENKLVFAFEDKNGGYHWVKSNDPLQANSFQKIAVTRKRGQKTIENKEEQTIEVQYTDDDGKEQTEKVTVEATTSVDVEEWDDVRIYIGQTESVNKRFEVNAGKTDQELEIGRISDDGEVTSFNGIISEIRLWNTAIEQDTLYSEVDPASQGLIAWWRFEENEGNITYDSKGTSHGKFAGAVQWVKNPDPEGSKFQLYLNGQSVKTKRISYSDWGDKQFTLAAYRKQDGSYQKYFNGILEEIRIWKVCRTQEQLQDNLFTRLKGEKQDLIANYTFDLEDETELKDSSLLGNHLQLGTGDSEPTSILSTAPISNDIAQVRSALSGVETQFHDTIDSNPAVQEYADMQYDADYNLFGIMKRCYSYIKEGQWHLYTGYKVGNLVTEWIGQAQFNPQIIGYLEGTPPVPSENMTYGTNGTGTGTYEGDGSEITFVQADQVMYNYATSKEEGFNTSHEGYGYGGAGTGTMELVAAPFGIGMTKEVEIDYKLTGGLNKSAASVWSDEKSLSTGANISREMSASLGGNWESPDIEGQLNPTVGRRWLSGNSGLALVQSETADIFALRLAHNNALVSLQFQPNPDIPKDWNIIAFPFNPRYIKQGVLDGKVGYNGDGSVCTDPDYPQATTYGEYSYFKPKEAYALKKQIDQEKQELQNYYNNFDTSFSNTQEEMEDVLSHIMGGLLPGVGNLKYDRTEYAALSENKSLSRQFSKRNIANTYVWTADGGFFAETIDTMDTIQDCISGSYSLSSGSSFGSAFNLNALVSFGYELNSSMGTSLNITKTKTKEATKTFSIDISLRPSGDMQEFDPVEGEPQYDNEDNDENGNPILVTGRVDAYRFMTFYLDSSKENFEDLFSKVIDPIWLEQSSHPNAVAMRQANQAEEKPGCWRLMHRVTFVSRVLPEFSSESPDSLENTMQDLDINSNYELIKILEPFVKNHTNSYVEFADAVRETIETYLPELSPYTDDIIRYAALYFGVEEEI